jgi:hypothetical protein
MAMALIQAGHYQLAADIADKGGYGGEVAAALNSATPSAGGVLIPATWPAKSSNCCGPRPWYAAWAPARCRSTMATSPCLA